MDRSDREVLSLLSDRVTVVDVVLPVLDEAVALPWVLSRFPAGYRPIVVDNGSTDGSGALARAAGVCTVEEPLRGFGAACSAGLSTATSDVVCFMDADASLDPRQLHRVAQPVIDGSADLVLGTRVGRGPAWPLHARCANRILVTLLHARTGLALADMGPMRAARREDLIGLGVRDQRFGWPLEMVVRAHRAGWAVEEVDVDYLTRAGRSKVTGTVMGTLRAARDMATWLR